MWKNCLSGSVSSPGNILNVWSSQNENATGKTNGSPNLKHLHCNSR